MRDWIQGAFSKAAASVAVAFVGAIPMARLAGFHHDATPQNQSIAAVAAGVILFCLTWAFAAPLARGVSRLFASLGRVETRPVPAIALALIVSGTICVLGSLSSIWSLRSSTPSASAMTEAVKQMERSMAALHAQGMGNVNFNANYPPAPDVTGPMTLTALSFALGACLIALGVWSSFGPHATHPFGVHANGFAHKEPIPGVDATRL